jgi:hypothetical protein
MSGKLSTGQSASVGQSFLELTRPPFAARAISSASAGRAISSAPVSTLAGDTSRVPSHVLQKVDERIARAV